MPFANFKFPQGLLNKKQKEEIIHKTTDMFAGYFGEGVRPYSMVLIDEVVDGGWGRADETLTLRTFRGRTEQSPTQRFEVINSCRSTCIRG